MFQRIYHACFSLAWFSIWLGLGLVLHDIPLAKAQKRNQLQTARRIYIQGMKFFNNNRFQEAEPLLEKAARLLPRTPRFARSHQKLDYYIGICNYKNKRYQSAQKRLERYMQRGTDRSKKRKARLTLLVMKRKGLLDRPDPQRRVPPPKRRVIPPSKRRTPLTSTQRRKNRRKRRKSKFEKPKKLVVVPASPDKRKVKVVVVRQQTKPSKPTYTWNPWPFVVLGLGAATAGAGGILGLLAKNAESDRDKTYQRLQDTQTPTEPASARQISELHRQAESFAGTANILMIAGGAVTVGGVVLLLLFGRTKQPLSAKKPISLNIPKTSWTSLVTTP